MVELETIKMVLLLLNTSLSLTNVISSAYCFEYTEYFNVIETDPLLSDGHSLLSLVIGASVPPEPIQQTKSETQHIHWQNDKLIQNRNNIDLTRLQRITEQLSFSPQSQQTVDYITHQVSDLLSTAANTTFSQKSRARSKFYNKRPWFGLECHRARKHFHRVKKRYQQYPSLAGYRTLYTYLISQWKTCIWYLVCLLCVSVMFDVNCFICSSCIITIYIFLLTCVTTFFLLNF
jgi:hypothetical protein